MSEDKGTYRIRLEKNGKIFTISYAGLWESLKEVQSFDEKFGWNGVTRALREDTNKFQDVVLDEILIPKAKDKVLAFLKEHPNVKTRNFYQRSETGLYSLAWYYAKEQLEDEGIIISISHGKGRNRTWNIKTKSENHD